MKITQLNIYPMKSARAVTLEQALCTPAGMEGDRRAMLCTPEGMFITQRDLPTLAQVSVVSLGNSTIRLSAEGLEPVVALPDAERDRINVNIWKDTVSAASASAEADEALSNWFKRPVRLCFFDERSKRIASRDWTSHDTPVGFADGFQILVTTTGSLSALNEDLEKHGAAPVGMDRFRPNIVLDCDDPWAEDSWSGIEVSGLTLEFVKPCARCIMTTQDQFSGSRSGANPMPAMGRLRMSADRRAPGPLFGWNAVPHGERLLRLGDEASVTGLRPEKWPLKRRTA